MSEYIEREALIKRLEVSPLLKPAFSFGENLRSGIIDLVKKQPTADVAEVKHGEWKLHKDGSGTCNQCRTTQKNVWAYDSWQNYCGHCGAKMDGKEKNNGLCGARKLMVDAPAVDAVEVVRCKDCKYYNDIFCYNSQWWDDDSKTVEENDFCSYGERKTDAR